jgi:Fur family transcriptional regulator, ferric uptake regulator
MSLHASIAAHLREKGHRITSARSTIIAALIQNKNPIAAQDLHRKLLKSAKPPNMVTVYRELKFLEEQGIAQSLRLQDAVRRYHLTPHKGHRHHLVCTSCKSVQPVVMACSDVHTLEQRIGRKNNFTVRSHALEFYGECGACVKKHP